MTTSSNGDIHKVDDKGGPTLYVVTPSNGPQVSSLHANLKLSFEEKNEGLDTAHADGSGGGVSGLTVSKTSKTNVSKEISKSAASTTHPKHHWDDIILVSTNIQDHRDPHNSSRMTNQETECDVYKTKLHEEEEEEDDDIEANSQDTCDMLSDDEDDGNHKNEAYKVATSDDTVPVTILQSDGNCLPTVQEIHHSDHHNPVKKPPFFVVTFCQSKNVILSFILVTVIVFVLMMTVLLSSSSSVSLFSSSTTSTSDQRFTSQYNRTMEYLVQNDISTSTALLTYGTPQYYATSYIANQLQLPVPAPMISSNTENMTATTADAIVLRQQQTYRYIARYVLALDYFYFTNYNATHHDNHFQQYNDQMQEDKEIVMAPSPPFINFVTSGMDLCQWNVRSNRTSSSLSDTDDIVDYYDTSSIQMGVTCSMSTKLPINLTISNMNLYGTIPTENGLLTSLEILNLDNNNLIGTIPTELCQLTNLQYLNLGRNRLTGNLPTEIGQLSDLETFLVNRNPEISGSIPSTIKQLTSLRTTFLDGTSVTSGVNQICTLPNYLSGDDTVVAYADCGGNAEVECDCCRCCNDMDNNGEGCSK